MDASDELLGGAVEIAMAAGRLAAQRFVEGTQVRTKADGSEVTAADTEVEKLLRSLITARFPGDGVAGEELTETAGTTGRRWILDPIDGTSAFVRRIPAFNVLVAVEDDDGGLASVMAGYPQGYEDIAPIPVMVTEAGGRVSDLEGNDCPDRQRHRPGQQRPYP